jgi:hypothetical protein
VNPAYLFDLEQWLERIDKYCNEKNIDGVSFLKGVYKEYIQRGENKLNVAELIQLYSSKKCQ